MNASVNERVILITGAGRRIGAAIAHALHADGARLLLHYRGSREEAQALANVFNGQRPDSAVCLQADLQDSAVVRDLAQQALNQWGRLDGLVNNASSFYPTPVGEIDEAAWDDLVGSNFKAPLFLSQACAPALAAAGGAIVNMVDIHAQRTLAQHSVYTAAKSALASLTRSLARDLAPQVRVNGIAPGTILWPEHDAPDAERAAQLEARIPLQRTGNPEDIAAGVRFLMSGDAAYVTGQILAIDGGASLV